jgi:hypothetical protein
MPLFTSILSPIIFIVFGTLAFKIEVFVFTNKYQLNKYLLIPILITIAIFSSRLYSEILSNHTSSINNTTRAANMNNYKINGKIAGQFIDKNIVVFNCKRFNAVPFMFQTGLTGYGSCPTIDEYKKLKEKKVRMAVFVDDKVSDFLLNDSSVIKLNHRLNE